MQVKKVCLSIALLTLALGSSAQMSEDGCVQCNVSLRGAAADTSSFEQINAAIDQEVSNLADQICDAMIIYDTTGIGPVHEAFEMLILDHLDLNKESHPNYKSEIKQFWNDNHQRMICRSETPEYESPQHILKRVVEMRGVNDFYFGYFLTDRDVNVNSIELRNGYPETIVDYLDSILEDPQSVHLYDTDDVRRLRSILVELMGAKTAQELMST